MASSPMKLVEPCAYFISHAIGGCMEPARYGSYCGLHRYTEDARAEATLMTWVGDTRAVAEWLRKRRRFVARRPPESQHGQKERDEHRRWLMILADRERQLAEARTVIRMKDSQLDLAAQTIDGFVRDVEAAEAKLRAVGELRDDIRDRDDRTWSEEEVADRLDAILGGDK